MTIKEFVETNEKIKNYKEEGKLTIELASDVADEGDFADFSDAEDLVLEEKINLLKTIIENNYKIEERLHKLINLFENLQNQVDAIEISD